MKGVEFVRHKKQIVALVLRRNIQVLGVKFFTDVSNPFQIGIHQRKKGTVLSPHIHKMQKSLNIDTIQEVLVIQEGKILVTLYTKEGFTITRKILKTGDSILLMKEGHGIKVLANTKIFEVKQGPYPGTEHAKIYFRS